MKMLLNFQKFQIIYFSFFISYVCEILEFEYSLLFFSIFNTFDASQFAPQRLQEGSMDLFAGGQETTRVVDQAGEMIRELFERFIQVRICGMEDTLKGKD